MRELFVAPALPPAFGSPIPVHESWIQSHLVCYSASVALDKLLTFTSFATPSFAMMVDVFNKSEIHANCPHLLCAGSSALRACCKP